MCTPVTFPSMGVARGELTFIHARGPGLIYPRAWAVLTRPPSSMGVARRIMTSSMWPVAYAYFSMGMARSGNRKLNLTAHIHGDWPVLSYGWELASDDYDDDNGNDDNMLVFSWGPASAFVGS